MKYSSLELRHVESLANSHYDFILDADRQVLQFAPEIYLVPKLHGGEKIYNARKLADWQLEILKDAGIKTENEYVDWDYSYMMSDADHIYQAGSRQEQILLNLGLL